MLQDHDEEWHVDAPATQERRTRARAARLAAARAPDVAVTDADGSGALLADAASQPLYHGVVQRGRYAIAEASGALQ